MANRNETRAVIVVAILTFVVMGGGLWLGFRAPSAIHHGPPVPTPPDLGPIVYDMHSVRSAPDRVRFQWRDVTGATAYHVTLMDATDDSLFVSPALRNATWVIPSDLRHKLKPQTVYHWRLRVDFAQGPSRVSEAAAFATE